MYLKTLTLKGFKSFAETTTLELEQGITVVVGPNGSGKSNIVDAVAWVLGAQGPSTVRSSRMDDVIFAGTSRRSALGRAEVTLTIDNSSGLLPLDLAEVTLTRTLFRSGESEYALNGAPCRLLDIQELLSDSGVGRTQHVIVGQGQLDVVLNARPEDRRAVVEEAAGVLKFRRRKERAERRLAATEGNLLRLTDLLREVRRSLRPLERQAEAARRHDELMSELTALRVHLAGRELAALRSRRSAAAATTALLKATDVEVRGALAELDSAVLAAESHLSAMGADDLGEHLVRAERLRERARGLAAVLAERRRGLERDRDAAIDQAVVATLEAESARLQAELAAAEAAAAALLPDAERLAQAEDRLRHEQAALGRFGEETVLAADRAAEVRGALAARQAAVGQLRAEDATLEGRRRALDERLEHLAAERLPLRAELAAADEAESQLVEAAERAEQELATTRSQLVAAEAALSEAGSQRAAWTGRADALSLALEETRASAGAARLAGLGGVLGALTDLVEVDEGWEGAFEAAMGPDLAVTVVEGEEGHVRRALATLEDAGSGAVLALLPRRSARSAPPSGEPVRRHVHARHEGTSLALDALLSGVVCVAGGWSEALDVALAHPDAVVVTREGHRFAPGGWRVGSGGPGATVAALEEACRRAAAAEADVARAGSQLEAAAVTFGAADSDAAELTRRLDDHDARLTAAADGLGEVENQILAITTEGHALLGQRAELAERRSTEEAHVLALQRELPRLEAREEERAKVEAQAVAIASLRTDLEIRVGAIDERRSYALARLAEVDARLSRHVTERAEAERRRVGLDRNVTAITRLAGLVDARLDWADGRLADLRERRRRHSEDARATAEQLDRLRRERAATERRLDEGRERARRAELEAQEVELRLSAAVEALQRDLDADPEAAADAPCPPLPEGQSASAWARALDRELRLLGPVNPLALEEFTALQERASFLESQLGDVRSSRRELTRVIRAVDEEIVRAFTAAYADVSENFARLFETLFPGGQGRLRLTEPDDLLATGIEVDARPSGKNVRKLSLLSGGERALTALAYLFAVFRSRPSPFYLLDEVEAALDDVNLSRFLDLVEEFRREAQVVVVSHQKRTMEAADALYGVSMQPGGTSKVVCERMAVATG